MSGLACFFREAQGNDMELLGTALRRVLADTRRRMDERKAGGAVEAPPEVPRGKGGETFAGESPGCDVAPAKVHRFIVIRGGTRPQTGAPGRQAAE